MITNNDQRLMAPPRQINPLPIRLHLRIDADTKTRRQSEGDLPRSALPVIKKVRVDPTFEPPWTSSQITEEGRDPLMALGYI